MLTTVDGWSHREASRVGLGGPRARGTPWTCFSRPGSGPWGRITRHGVRSAPHRSSAIALEHGHSVTKRDISLRKHVCVTRSLLKAIMADAQPFNTYGGRRRVQFRGPTCVARESPRWRRRDAAAPGETRTPIGGRARA